MQFDDRILKELYCFEKDKDLISKSIEWVNIIENTLGEPFNEYSERTVKHGILHSRNVALIASFFCIKNKINPTPVILAAYFHDLGREKQGHDPDHDKRSAKIFEKFAKENLKFLKPHYHQQVLSFILDHNEIDMDDDNGPRSYFKDADKLAWIISDKLVPKTALLCSDLGNSFCKSYFLNNFCEDAGDGHVNLYHFTHIENMNSILENGLMPSFCCKLETQDLVYFTSDKEKIYGINQKQEKVDLNHIENIDDFLKEHKNTKGIKMLLRVKVHRDDIDFFRTARNIEKFGYIEMGSSKTIPSKNITQYNYVGTFLDNFKFQSEHLLGIDSFYFYTIQKYKNGRTPHYPINRILLTEPIEKFGSNEFKSLSNKKEIFSSNKEFFAVIRNAEILLKYPSILNIVNMSKNNSDEPFWFFSAHGDILKTRTFFTGIHNGQDWKTYNFRCPINHVFQYKIKLDIGVILTKKRAVLCLGEAGQEKLVPSLHSCMLFENLWDKVSFYIGSCNPEFASAPLSYESISVYQVPLDIEKMLRVD